MLPVGIDVQTVFGMPPVDYVRFVAELGCTHFSLGLEPPPWNPCRFPSWSLRDDSSLRRDFISAMGDTGVRVYSGEGFAIRQGQDIHGRARDLDLMSEFGARQVNTVIMETDESRSFDQLAQLAEMTEERGMLLGLEFAPPHAVNNLEGAFRTTERLDMAHVSLVIDSMHFFRSGGQIEELAHLENGLIGYVQLCDVPQRPADDDYLTEACFMRQIPGEGELPLVSFLEALPENVLVGVEVPMRRAAEDGDLMPAVKRAVERTRELLEASGRWGG